MTMQAEKLIELAERCEAANGPDRELDAAIVMALFPEAQIGEYCGYDDIVFHAGPLVADKEILPFSTASLDAAITLIPADAFWRVGHDGEGADPALFLATILVPQLQRASRAHDAIADWPALALTAAALRARAATLSTDAATPAISRGEG